MQVIIPHCSPSEEVDEVQILLKNGDIMFVKEDEIVGCNTDGLRTDIPMSDLFNGSYDGSCE